jgi:hypothetical protein
MKTVSILASVATFGLFVAVATGSVMEPLMTPKARSNQISKTSGVTEERLDRSVPMAPPKFLKQRASSVAGSSEDRVERRLFSASPKALENFPNLAAITALPAKPEAGMMACCKGGTGCSMGR